MRRDPTRTAVCQISRQKSSARRIPSEKPKATSINVSAFYPGKELGVMAISGYGALAALLAMLFLKEHVAWGQWLGIVMIAVGVCIIGWPA